MPKTLYYNPVARPVLKRFYPLFLGLSFAFSIAAAGSLCLSVRESWESRWDNFNIWMISLYGCAATAQLFSALAIMARTGAHWNHAAHFTVYLPVGSMAFPVIGTPFCVWCLLKIYRDTLPCLSLGGVRQHGRSGADRPIRGTVKIYRGVPLAKSGISSVFNLSVVLLSHLYWAGYCLFILIRGVKGPPGP